jgi:hypothetical protein
MKKNLLLFLLPFCFYYSFAQTAITSRTVATAETGEKTLPYDSLTLSITKKNVMSYKDQDAYFLKLSPAALIDMVKENPGTSPFEYDDLFDRFTTKPFVPDWGIFNSNKTIMYKPYLMDRQPLYGPKSNFASDYRKIMGQSYKIIDVIIDVPKGNPTSNADLVDASFKLQNKATGEILYYHNRPFPSPTEFTTNGLFIIEGYYKKLKQKYVNTNFYVENSTQNVNDINNGKPVIIASGSTWVCSDVALLQLPNNLNEDLYFIFKNKDGAEIAQSIFRVTLGDDWVTQEVMDKRKKEKEEFAKNELAEKLALDKRNAVNDKEAAAANKKELNMRIAKYTKKYGPTLGKKIANKEVSLGMTRQMCTDALGDPDKINETVMYGVHSEQWIYDSNTYLYFRNNKLVTYQD